MANRRVWVEADESGRPSRILKHVRFGQNLDNIREMPRYDAEGAIRHQVYERCGGKCEWCGRRIPESGPLRVRMHRHEVIPKGNGGEVSMANCVGICYDCHINGAHANRRPQFSKGKTFEEVMEGE